jgi:hypothetical protein
MAKPYSQDLRDRVIDAVEREEMSRRAAARRYEISESVAIKWLERVPVARLALHQRAQQRDVGEIAPRVPLDDARLSLVNRETQHRRPLAGTQDIAVVDEPSGITGDGARHAVLAAAPTDNAPQLTNPMLRRI